MPFAGNPADDIGARGLSKQREFFEGILKIGRTEIDTHKNRACPSCKGALSGALLRA